jgi:hypothetical protein
MIILRPYKRINEHVGLNEYARHNLNLMRGFNDYVFQDGRYLPNPEKWRICSHTLNVFSGATYHLYDTHIDAMNALDALLINKGIKLLNSQEDVDKCLILL